MEKTKEELKRLLKENGYHCNVGAPVGGETAYNLSFPKTGVICGVSRSFTECTKSGLFAYFSGSHHPRIGYMLRPRSEKAKNAMLEVQKEALAVKEIAPKGQILWLPKTVSEAGFVEVMPGEEAKYQKMRHPVEKGMFGGLVVLVGALVVLWYFLLGNIKRG